MDERSTQELESALAEGDLSPRKKAFAKEVLRRRYEGKDDWSLWTHAWLSLLGVLGLARTALRRIRGRCSDSQTGRLLQPQIAGRVSSEGIRLSYIPARRFKPRVASLLHNL
jgi:hypothetical protein